MNAILSLAAKDLKLLLRDGMGFFFTLIFPLIMSLFFGVIFSGNGGRGPQGVPIAIIDEDHSEGSRKMVDLIMHIPQLRPTEMAGRADAIELVRRGQQSAAVILPKGFGDFDYRIFRDQPLHIQMAPDPSRRAEAAMIQGLLTAKSFQFVQLELTSPQRAGRLARQALADPQIPAQYQLLLRPLLPLLENALAKSATTAPTTSPAVPFQLVQIETLPLASANRQMRNAYSVSFPQGITWGLIGCAASFGISLVTERNHGTLTRLCVAPISRLHVLLGKALACFATTLAAAVGLLAVAYIFFNVKPINPLLLALGLSCSSIAFVGITMFLSVIGKTERAAAGIGWAIMLLMSMIGGGMVPLMFMPPWLVKISPASPVRWAILAIEGPLWRGFSFSEMLLPCGILLAIGAAGLLLGARSFGRLRSL